MAGGRVGHAHADHPERGQRDGARDEVDGAADSEGGQQPLRAASIATCAKPRAGAAPVRAQCTMRAPAPLPARTLSCTGAVQAHPLTCLCMRADCRMGSVVRRRSPAPPPTPSPPHTHTCMRTSLPTLAYTHRQRQKQRQRQRHRHTHARTNTSQRHTKTHKDTHTHKHAHTHTQCIPTARERARPHTHKFYTYRHILIIHIPSHTYMNIHVYYYMLRTIFIRSAHKTHSEQGKQSRQQAGWPHCDDTKCGTSSRSTATSRCRDDVHGCTAVRPSGCTSDHNTCSFSHPPKPLWGGWRLAG